MQEMAQQNFFSRFLPGGQASVQAPMTPVPALVETTGRRQQAGVGCDIERTDSKAPIVKAVDPGTDTKPASLPTPAVRRCADVRPAMHPASYHAAAFVEWLNTSIFDPASIAAVCGPSYGPIDPKDFGIHRYYRDTTAPNPRLYAEILCTDVQSGYHEMCGEHNWSPHKWNTIASELRSQLGGGKTYTWVVHDDGIRRKRRCYRLPVPDSYRQEHIEPQFRAAA